MAESNDEMSGSNFRRTGNQQLGKQEFRFLIPSKVASVIIGKGGERIQRLRHQCNARLSIPDNQGAERVFAVEGTVDNCLTIWNDCFHEVKDFMGSRNPDNDELDIRLLYHTTLVGNIIGKGGEVIKNMKTNYALTVLKVYPTPCPGSSERVVQLVGNLSEIFQCVNEIVDILAKQVPKGDVVRYDCNNSDDSLSSQYGGWGSGKGGSFGDGIRGGFQESSGRMNKSRDMGPPRRESRNEPRWNNGSSSRSGMYKSSGHPSDDFGGRSRMDSRKRYGNEFEDFGGKKPRDFDYNQQYYENYGMNTYQSHSMGGFEPPSKSRVSVPRSFIDYINQDNASKLWNIMKDSGAEIMIEQTNSPQGVLSITGTKDQIQGAQYLLQICLKKFSLNV